MAAINSQPIWTRSNIHSHLDSNPGQLHALWLIRPSLALSLASRTGRWHSLSLSLLISHTHSHTCTYIQTQALLPRLIESLTNWETRTEMSWATPTSFFFWVTSSDVYSHSLLRKASEPYKKRDFFYNRNELFSSHFHFPSQMISSHQALRHYKVKIQPEWLAYSSS